MNLAGLWDQLVDAVCRPPRDDAYTDADLVGGRRAAFRCGRSWVLGGRSEQFTIAGVGIRLPCLALMLALGAACVRSAAGSLLPAGGASPAGGTAVATRPARSAPRCSSLLRLSLPYPAPPVLPATGCTSGGTTGRTLRWTTGGGSACSAGAPGLEALGKRKAGPAQRLEAEQVAGPAGSLSAPPCPAPLPAATTGRA